MKDEEVSFAFFRAYFSAPSSYSLHAGMAQHVEAVRCNGLILLLLLVGFAVGPTSCEHACFLFLYAHLAGLRALTKKAEAEQKESKVKRNKQPARLYPKDAGDNLRDELCADDRGHVQTFCLRAVAK